MHRVVAVADTVLAACKRQVDLVLVVAYRVAVEVGRVADKVAVGACTAAGLGFAELCRAVAALGVGMPVAVAHKVGVVLGVDRHSASAAGRVRHSGSVEV